MPRHSVGIFFVRSTLAVARKNGLDDRVVLSEARISPELVRVDSARVTAEQATDLMQSVWRLSGDELLGLAPKPVPLGTFEMICLALIHSRDLRSAVTRMLKFMALSTGIGTMRLREGDGVATIDIRPAAGQITEAIVVEVLIALVQRFSAWLIGRRIPLLALDLPFSRPSHDPDYDSVFGRTPRFDKPWASLAFDARFLEAPVVRDEPDLSEFLKNSPADLLFRRDYGTSVSYKVRKILERAEPNRLEAADDVAGRLAVSTQHMRRLLHHEGTSFRRLREEILRDTAITSLVSGKETVEELSVRLGFSESSAFRRAFTRWTGSSVGAYRSRIDRG